MPERAGRPPRDFRVAIPGSWVELDLDPATSRKSIQTLVEQRTGVMARDAEGVRRLATVLRDATADAARQGAVYAAMYSDVLEGRPVSASLIGSIAPVEDGYLTDGAEPDLERLAGDLVDRFDHAEATVVVLPAGPAVRLRRRWTTPFEGRDVEVAGVQYFVPIPESPHMVLLNFSTPTVGLADPFAELFDAIAESLRWRW